MRFTVEKGSEEGAQKGVSRRYLQCALGEYAPLGVRPRPVSSFLGHRFITIGSVTRTPRLDVGFLLQDFSGIGGGRGWLLVCLGKALTNSSQGLPSEPKLLHAPFN